MLELVISFIIIELNFLFLIRNPPGLMTSKFLHFCIELHIYMVANIGFLNKVWYRWYS